MVPGPAAAVLSENLLERQIPRPHLLNQVGTLGLGPAVWVLTSLPGNSDARLSLQTTGLVVSGMNFGQIA